MKTLIISLLALFLGVGMLPFVHANCFKSISLGEFPLGEWSDAGRTWVVSDMVGSISDTFTTKSALETQKNTLLGQCTTKGNAVIAKVEERLNQRKAGLGAEFDKWCTDTFFCPMVRDISIQSRTNEIDQEIVRMKGWYKTNIEKCKQHFNYMHNTLSTHLCS